MNLEEIDHNPIITSPRVVIVGAGAIGGSLATWIAPFVDALYIKEIGTTKNLISEKGIKAQGPKSLEILPPDQFVAIDSLKDAGVIDILIIAVKNYHLDQCCQELKSELSALLQNPLVIGLQNGIANQTILPKYFSDIILGVIGYNAWLITPNIVHYQNRGPLVLGAFLGTTPLMLRQLEHTFNKALPTIVLDDLKKLQDAVHCKMIINLTNSLTTLVDYKFETFNSDPVFQKILTRMTWEGVQVLKKSGLGEFVIGGMPRWRLIQSAALLPRFITAKKFRSSLKKMVISSMAQDILQRGQTDSELSSINGHIIELAKKSQTEVPFNMAIYELCVENFAKKPFIPLKLNDVWDKIANI